MGIWVALLLGLVQGLTEFLPVSSSGHLLLLQEFFGVSDDSLFFEIMLHVATLCAVVIVFRKKIWDLIKKPFQPTMYFLVIATAITCAMFLVLKKVVDVDSVFGDIKILPFMFLVTAIVLFLTTLIKPKKETEVGYKTSIAAGFAQGIALIPGISRSGSTIAASLFAGTKREDAAEFAFLMSIPAILASLVYTIIDSPSAVLALDPLPLLVGFVAAFVAGILAIKFMLKIIKNIKLYWFSAYLTVLSIILLFVIYL